MIDNKNLQEFISGNMGGMIGIALVYPLDTAKIRIQTNPALYRTTFGVISSMTKQSGYVSLYRGLMSPSFGYGMIFAISFCAYGSSCRKLCEYRGHSTRDDLKSSDLAIAGVITGIAQAPMRQVVERIKSVMQVWEKGGGKSPYSWSGSCFWQLVKTQGIKVGLFQGFESVLWREVPQYAIYYPSYEISKKYFDSTELMSPLLSQFCAGGVAGAVQWLPPFYFADVIKSRMQTAPAGTYTNALNCAKILYRDEGAAVFFRGLTPALARSIPLHATIFAVFNYCQTLWEDKNTNSNLTL